MKDDADPWVRREPGFTELRTELMRLARRARRRPVLTIFFALSIALAVAYRRSRKPENYMASVTFRISEGTQIAATPMPARELSEYVSLVVFATPRLAEVMRAHKVMLRKLDNDQAEAITEFRENLEVEVYRNYFIEGWQSNKSARLTVNYYDEDKQRAQEVVGSLGELIVAEETRRRADAVSAALTGARGAERGAREDLEKREKHIAELQVAMAQRSGPRSTLARQELDAAKNAMGPAVERLARAEVTLADLELAMIFEVNRQTVRFEKVDESTETVSGYASWRLLAILTIAMLFFTFPMAIVAIGAFDSRVYDMEDVRRLGITAVGHVPHFRGDRVGSLAARSRATGRR
jgi:hypothetical protein